MKQILIPLWIQQRTSTGERNLIVMAKMPALTAQMRGYDCFIKQVAYRAVDMEAVRCALRIWESKIAIGNKNEEPNGLESLSSVGSEAESEFVSSNYDTNSELESDVEWDSKSPYDVSSVPAYVLKIQQSNGKMRWECDTYASSQSGSPCLSNSILEALSNLLVPLCWTLISQEYPE